MTEQQPATTFSGAGQAPETPQQGDAGAQGVAQPEFVTAVQAQQMAKAAAEEAYRRAQSLIDKTVSSNASVLKGVQSQLNALTQSLDLQRKAGIAVTPEQEAMLRARVLEQAFVEPATPALAGLPGQPIPAAPAQPTEPALDPITAEAVRLQSAAGITIEDNDPELGLIAQTSPTAFLKSVEAAIEAKKLRLSKGSQPPEKASPGARQPGMQGGQPASEYRQGHGLDDLQEYFKNR